MLIKISPLKKIVVTYFAKFLWKTPFTSEELKGFSSESFSSWNIKLVDHLEKTISASNVYVEKNKLPLSFKELFKESIILLYQAYRRMLLWKTTYYVKDDIDLLKEGELFAPNYFTVDGEFNHYAWAKRFVLDPAYKISDRFDLACFYWFENETAILWSELKNLNIAPYNGNLYEIKNTVHPMITLRIFHLEDQLKFLAGNDTKSFQLEDFLDMFYRGRDANEIINRVILRTAALKGFEYAAHHFWQKMSETEKKNIIESHVIFSLISLFTEYPYAKISFFFYSLLSEKRKKDFLDSTVEYNEEEKYLTLLHYAYNKPISSEIIQFVNQLPIKSLNYLLNFSACRIRGLKLPLDIEIFQMLWCNLPPEKHNVLKKGFIIECFVEAKALSFLSYIIKGLSIEQKKKYLLEPIKKGIFDAEDEEKEHGCGIRCLNILSEAGEFDSIPKYLSFFLVEINQCTQQDTLREDASLLLQMFIETPHFKEWCNKISKSILTKVNAQIDALITSLTLVNEICEKVSEQINI